MDPQRAKFLLHGGPPRAGDREDPAFVEALAHAETEPVLGAWARRQQALTDALSDKLNELEVPVHLKNHILAGGIVSQRAHRYRRRSWLAAAASFTALLGLAAWPWLSAPGVQPPSFARLQADLCEFLAGSFELEVRSASLESLRAHLGRRHQFTNYAVPAALAAQPGVGCRMIDWHGRQVALICFTSQGQLVHLMVTPRASWPEHELPLERVHEQVDGWATAGWVQDGNVYLVATRGTPEMLASLL